MHEDDSDVLIRELFDTVDLDSSGYIDERELAAVVDLSADDLKEIFQKLDTDKDGKISVEEFIENYKQFQKIANENFINNPGDFVAKQNEEKRISRDNLLDVSKQTPEEIINRLPRNTNQIYMQSSSSSTGRSVNYRPKRLPLKRDIKRKAARYLGQEYLDDLYEIARARNDPMLIESLENFLTATVESLLQKQSENEKLDSALKRATEKNTEIAQELEYEMEHQVAVLEAKIREEERLKLEQQKQEANFQILKAQQELNEMEDKVKTLEERVSQRVTEIPDSIINVIQKKEKENEELQRKLLEFQTQMALMRTEVANMKAEYDEQSERLSNERGTVLTCVQEQENLTRQLHLLHEANRKLHDTNDDLRSALDSRRSLSSSFSASPSSPVKKLFNGASPIKRPGHGSSFRSDPGSYTTVSRGRKASSIASGNSDFNDTDDEIQRSILPEDREASMFQQSADQVNNESLLSEIMAADGNLYGGNQVYTSPARGQMTPDSYVSTPLHQTSDREQFVRQLEILCDTNRRLGESNDELRQALGMLSERLRHETSMADMPRPPPTGCQSAPVTPMRSKTESEAAPRPQSTSSPRKVLLTKSGYHSSMPDLSSESVNEESCDKYNDSRGKTSAEECQNKSRKQIEENITSSELNEVESMPALTIEEKLYHQQNKTSEVCSDESSVSSESSQDFSSNDIHRKNDNVSSNSYTAETLNSSGDTTHATTNYSDFTKTRDVSDLSEESGSDYSFSRNHETTQISLTQDDTVNQSSRHKSHDSFEDESQMLTKEVMQIEESTIFDDDTTQFNETTFLNDVNDETTVYPSTTHDLTKTTDAETFTSNSTSDTLASLHLKSPSNRKNMSSYSDSTLSRKSRKCECGNVISHKDYTICDDCFDEDTDVVVEEISFDENTASVYSVPGTTIYGNLQNKNIPDVMTNDKSIQCDIDHFAGELNESNITELNKSINFLQNPSISHVCNPRFCQCDIQETNLPNEKCTQVSEFMLLQSYEEIEPLEVKDDESSMDNIMVEIDKLDKEYQKNIKNEMMNEKLQQAEVLAPNLKQPENNVSLHQWKSTNQSSKLDPNRFSLSEVTSLNANPALTTKQNLTNLTVPINSSNHTNNDFPIDYCPVCQHVITLHETTRMRQCLCTVNDDDDTFVNKSIHQVAESIILTDSDSNNYSDQETMFSPLKRMRPVGSEHEEQDATYETNFGLTKDDDNTWVSGFSSTYSQFQQYDAQLSMFARRQDDEDIDEDDMDDEELIRIVDQTNPDTDDMSGSITEEPITVEEKILEPRGNAVGADTASDVSQDGPLETTITNKDPDCLYKLVLAGNAAVGKSSFIIRLCKDKFYSALNSTLGVDFQIRTMNVDGSTVALQLWDTAGQERFRSIAKSYFRRVDGVVLLYDVTCENSFLDVRDWLESIQSSASKDIPIIICGNKVDLRPYALKRGMPCVSRADGERLAKEVGALFIETSAKDGINVNKACLQLARKLQANEYERNEDQPKKGLTLDKNQNINDPQPKKAGCCK